jgi:hypothetical protein
MLLVRTKPLAHGRCRICCQSYKKNDPDAGQTDGITHKLISVTGAPAHILFYETNQFRLADDATAAINRFDTQVPILSDMPETASLCHRSGARIWPA